MAIQYHHALDRTFHALGDSSRRRMLAELAERGECTASDLARPFDVAQPTVSKHIKVLERAGLVERRIDGRNHVFRLVQAPLDEAESWIARHRKFWKGTLRRLERYLDEEGQP